MSGKHKTAAAGATPAAAEGAVLRQKEPACLVYVGPTIPGVIRRSTVFKKGVLPKKAQDCVSEFPMMGRLFVETGKLPYAAKELNKKQSVLGEIYSQVEQRFVRRV